MNKFKKILNSGNKKMSGEKKIKKRILRGFQDLLPEKMLVRNALIEKITANYKRFGFFPQDTPCLEYADLLLGKYGEEGENLIYEFRDKGNRHVAMRYDLTVPLSRIIQMYGKSITFPYRRYQIGKVWRADKPGKGRYREFTQVDIDIIGDDSVLSDVEIPLVIISVMKDLNIQTVVKINSREILNSLIEICNLDEENGINLMRVIDKFEKVGIHGVISELAELNFKSEVVNIVKKYLSIQGDNEEILAGLQKLLSDAPSFEKAFKRITEVTKMLNDSGNVKGRFNLEPSIARGLDYYTGIIFETIPSDDPSIGSICSGGRYDRLIKLPSGEFTPAVGTSIGLDRLYDVMESVNLLPKIKTTTDVFIVNFNQEDVGQYLQVASELRENGIAVEVSSKPGKLGKQLKTANKKGIPVVLIIGPSEITNDEVVIKNMAKRTQKKIPRKQLVTELKN